MNVLVFVVERRITHLADDDVPKMSAFGTNGIGRNFHAAFTARAENKKHGEPFRSECRDMSGRGGLAGVPLFW